jgi:hypothetical protein
MTTDEHDLIRQLQENVQFGGKPGWKIWGFVAYREVSWGKCLGYYTMWKGGWIPMLRAKIFPLFFM